MKYSSCLKRLKESGSPLFFSESVNQCLLKVCVRQPEGNVVELGVKQTNKQTNSEMTTKTIHRDKDQVGLDSGSKVMLDQVEPQCLRSWGSLWFRAHHPPLPVDGSSFHPG